MKKLIIILCIIVILLTTAFSASAAPRSYTVSTQFQINATALTLFTGIINETCADTVYVVAQTSQFVTTLIYTHRSNIVQVAPTIQFRPSENRPVHVVEFNSNNWTGTVRTPFTHIIQTASTSTVTISGQPTTVFHTNLRSVLNAQINQPGLADTGNRNVTNSIDNVFIVLLISLFLGFGLFVIKGKGKTL